MGDHVAARRAVLGLDKGEGVAAGRAVGILQDVVMDNIVLDQYVADIGSCRAADQDTDTLVVVNEHVAHDHVRLADRDAARGRVAYLEAVNGDVLAVNQDQRRRAVLVRHRRHLITAVNDRRLPRIGHQCDARVLGLQLDLLAVDAGAHADNGVAGRLDRGRLNGLAGIDNNCTWIGIGNQRHQGAARRLTIVGQHHVPKQQHDQHAEQNPKTIRFCSHLLFSPRCGDASRR